MEPRIEAGVRVEEALALARPEGWTWTPRSVARVLAMQPDGAFTARDAQGAPLGIVTCVVWDKLAWIGSMVVATHARRRGVARALLRRAIAHAEARGATSIGADATPEARPLYEGEGFVPTWGESALWTREGAPRAQPPPTSAWAIYPVSPAEIMELLAYDAPRFGAGRGRHLAHLMGEEPHRSFVAVHRKSGAFEGHGFAHERGIGPLVADAPESAAQLLRALETARAPPRAIVPAWNPRAEALFAAAGYTKGRARLRMVRGAPLPGRPEAVYAVGAWALG
ncbi:MAG TPA: GNAT family N-acetyltransferase [Candidatus Thermoplasmatota archaeon]|nr:GNAT family N-acetyltransferase [Candidatus Thermoplasmatota archaeon]